MPPLIPPSSKARHLSFGAVLVAALGAGCTRSADDCVATRSCPSADESGAASDGATELRESGSPMGSGGADHGGAGGSAGAGGEPGAGGQKDELGTGGVDDNAAHDAAVDGRASAADGETHDGGAPPSPLYISPGGDDMNTGARLSPFKTFDKAASLAVSGQEILAAPGTYGGSDFSKPIPDGVTVDRSTATGVVTFAPSTARTLVFAGSGTLRNVTLNGFYTPIAASSGDQTLESVSVTRPTDAITLLGTAHATFTNVDVSGLPATASVPFVGVEANATLTMTKGSFSGGADNCTEGATAVGVTVRGAGAASFEGTSFQGYIGVPIDHQSTGALVISNGYFKTCTEAFVALVPKTGVVTVRGTTLWGEAVVGGTGKLVVRGSTFWGATGVLVGSGDATSVFDFGTPSDPGGNDFSHTTQGGLVLFAGGLSATASGNKWIPGIQGADAQGHYATGAVVTVPGKNVGLASGDSVTM